MTEAAMKKKELFEKDIAKAMDSIEKANKALEKAKARLPKRTPKLLPPGSALFADYGQVSLQEVFDDLNAPQTGAGITQGLLDCLGKIKNLAEGEAGFEFG